MCNGGIYMFRRFHLFDASGMHRAGAFWAVLMGVSFCTGSLDAKPHRRLTSFPTGSAYKKVSTARGRSKLHLRRFVKTADPQSSTAAPNVATASPPSPPPPPADSLQDSVLSRQLQQHAMGHGGSGDAVGTPMTGFAQEAEGHASSVRLRAGECYLVVAIGESSMRSLTTSLWSPFAERQITIIGQQAPWTAIRARFSGEHKLIVRPAGGPGQYAAGMYPYPCPTE